MHVYYVYVYTLYNFWTTVGSRLTSLSDRTFLRSTFRMHRLKYKLVGRPPIPVGRDRETLSLVTEIRGRIPCDTVRFKASGGGVRDMRRTSQCEREWSGEGQWYIVI